MSTPPAIGNLLDFSDEVLIHILTYLQTNVSDLVHISHTCTKLDALLQDRSICEKLRFKWHIYVQRLSLVKFLQHPNRALLITQLNMNDMYWVPSSVIRNIAMKTSNLKELYVAGTSFSWTHLLQVIKSTSAQHIQCLSISWNNSQIADPKPASFHVHDLGAAGSQQSAPWKTQIDSIKPQLQQLKFLLIHIPEMFNTSSLIFASYSSLSHFVSCCKSLEQLQIMSWPKTIQELKNTATVPSSECLQMNDITFPNLHTFVLSVMEPQRIYLPRLVNCVMRSVSENRSKDGYKLKCLWLDHPLLERHLKQDKVSEPWPAMNFRDIESLSLPLLEESLQVFPHLVLENCKHLQLTNGAPRIISLSGIIEKTQRLTSICSKSFNYRLDWYKLAARNPGLTELNVCEDSTLPYPEFCVAISSLYELKKLALPTYCLIEIKDPSLRAQYCDSSSIELPEPHEDSIAFKRRRIGTSSKAIPKKNYSLNGLDIIATSCREIEEFELGFTKTESRPGKIVVESLFSICKWTNLRKLTLDQIPIISGMFLVEVAKSCQLEVLRLSHLGPRAKCIYVNDLCSALCLCSKLNDFRLDQNYIGSSRSIFKSLESCKQLSRVMLISDSNDRSLEEDVLPNLLEVCHNLSVLYTIIGSTPKYICKSIRQTIESKFRRSRPPLSVVIRNSIHGESPHYPSIHYRQLVLLLPEVCRSSHFPVAAL